MSSRLHSNVDSDREGSSADAESGETLAGRILELDQDVIGCYIIRVADAAVLADIVIEKYRSTMKPFASAGVASKWGLVGLPSSKRMDKERGRTKYIVAARESFSTLLFPHPNNEDLEIGIMLTPEAEPRKIYNEAMSETPKDAWTKQVILRIP